MKINGFINKGILVILVFFMILPSSIRVLNVSIFKIVSIIIGLIFIYLFIIRKEDMKTYFKNKFILYNIIFAISIAISLIANYKIIQFNDTFEIAKYIILAMVSMIVITICQEKQYFIFLLKIINITMIIICVFGIIQYFNPFSINELYVKYYAPTQYKTLVDNYPNPRIVGIKSNPSVYGMLVSLGIYFNLIYYKYTKYTKHKIWCWISILLCMINLMMTLTRTIQVAFICSIIIFILISVLLKKGWKKAILATVITICIITLVVLLLPEHLTWRLIQVIDFSNATSWIGRVGKWKNYIDIVKENFLFGIGPVKNHIQQLGYIDSEIIQNILQYGVLGFIAYILMLLSPLYIYIKDKTNKEILKYYIPIIVMIIINNIASSSLILFDTAMGIYIIIGLILSNNNIVIEKKESIENEKHFNNSNLFSTIRRSRDS